MASLRDLFMLASSSALIVASGCQVRVEDDSFDDDAYDGWYDDDYGGSSSDPLRSPPYGNPASDGVPDVPDVPPLGYPDGGTSGDVEPLRPDLPPSLYPALIVIDADIIRGPLAANASADAPFSFRAQMEWLAGDRDAIDFTQAWLEQWETVTTVGPAAAPVVPRPAARRRLLEPWLGANAASSADAGAYGTSSPSPANGTPPSWANAPFRLIAIVNRVDLASDPCSTGGELRFIYTAIDVSTGAALDMTAILEVPYPSTRTAAEWARAWRDLPFGGGSGYSEALARLVRDVHAEADPLRARLLTSEVELASAESPGWEMREFHLQIEGDRLGLVQTPLDRTPRADVDAARLSDHVLEHADEIRAAGARLPDDMQAGVAPLATPDFRWRVLGVSESLRHAFSLQTCNGCHGGDAEPLPFQHVTPVDLPGISARVSRTLYAPDEPSDELRRRSLLLDSLAQSACEPAPGSTTYP
ncbi:MAG TPA: hypothetical protein VMG12_18790 [Polyangiaceae bacterium]|nr:hypothetical protein [Polyangiaceae bacterium]